MDKMKDGKGNIYFDVGNIRITCIGSSWDGGPGIRVQAYKGSGRSLHRGAELPVPDASTAYNLIAAIVSALEVELKQH